jgi:predicted transglutaminase-like cysteine proteinase
MKLFSTSLVSLVLLVCCALTTVANAIDYEKLQKVLSARFGNQALQNFNAWQSLMQVSRNVSADEKLNRINEFVNRRIAWGDDKDIWGQPDYWATPIETLGRGAGDCEDFAILKYYSLIDLGIPATKLRLIYVKAQNVNFTDSGAQAHMVMAYYSSPDAEPMILDSLITEIRPASRRPDLQPLFSFNTEGIYAGAGGRAGRSVNARLSRWQSLMQRAQEEGF